MVIIVCAYFLNLVNIFFRILYRVRRNRNVNNPITEFDIQVHGFEEDPNGINNNEKKTNQGHGRDKKPKKEVTLYRL